MRRAYRREALSSAGKVKKFIADNDINFYTIDAFKIGKELGLGTRTNTVLQSAFFSIAKIIPEEDAIKYMKDAATKSYSRKGDAIVKMNHDAIDRGATGKPENKLERRNQASGFPQGGRFAPFFLFCLENR